MSQSLHAEHRKRMRERALRDGLDTLQDHEVLEVLLYYCIPRADTNGIAHRLLGAFGSLHRVLEAEPHELQKVEGLGKNSAEMLALFLQVYRRYEMDKRDWEFRSISLDSVQKLENYFRPQFIGQRREMVIAVCLDARRRPLHCDVISTGTVSAADVNLRRIVELAVQYQAVGVALAHNHPGGLPRPSNEDLQETAYLRRQLDALGVELVDHLILADEGCCSLVEGECFRTALYIPRR